jgi:hypothetical protein
VEHRHPSDARSFSPGALTPLGLCYPDPSSLIRPHPLRRRFKARFRRVDFEPLGLRRYEFRPPQLYLTLLLHRGRAKRFKRPSKSTYRNHAHFRFLLSAGAAP